MSRRTKLSKRSAPPAPAIYANATPAERRAIARDFARLDELEAMAAPIRARFEARKKELLDSHMYPDEIGAAKLAAEFRPFAALLSGPPTRPLRDLICGFCHLPVPRCTCLDANGQALDYELGHSA